MPNTRALAPALLLSLLPAAAAQNQTPTSASTTTTKQTPTQTSSAPVRLHDQSTRFEALGVWLHLPEGCLVETTSIGGSRQSVTIRPPDATWQIELEDRTSRDRTLAPAAVAADILADLQKAWAVWAADQSKQLGSRVEVRDRNDALTINSLPAARFYALTPTASDATVMTGYTVVRLEPGRFLLAALTCLPAEFDRARAVYEASIGSLGARDPAEAAAERAAAAIAGADLLDRLSRDDYLASLPKGERWYRLFRPRADSHETDEIAYQRVVIRAGRRGELNPRKPRSSWNKADNDEGILVRVIARYVEPNRMVDSDSTFFAAFTDLGLGDEAWTIRMGIRDRKDKSVWTETGARLANRLSVRVEAPAAPPSEKSWVIPERGYISQAHTLLLPRLLVRAGSPMVYAFYAYNSATNEITLRREVLARGPGDGWTLRTRVGEGVSERVATLDPTGEILRLEMGDGTVMEPVTVSRLQELWKAKGLPTGKVD